MIFRIRQFNARWGHSTAYEVVIPLKVAVLAPLLLLPSAAVFGTLVEAPLPCVITLPVVDDMTDPEGVYGGRFAVISVSCSDPPVAPIAVELPLK